MSLFLCAGLCPQSASTISLHFAYSSPCAAPVTSRLLCSKRLRAPMLRGVLSPLHRNRIISSHASPFSSFPFSTTNLSSGHLLPHHPRISRSQGATFVLPFPGHIPCFFWHPSWHARWYTASFPGRAVLGDLPVLFTIYLSLAKSVR